MSPAQTRPAKSHPLEGEGPLAHRREDRAASAALIPSALRGTNWEATIRAAAAAIILVAPAIMVVRQVQRASIRGTAVQLSRTQFPDLYASADGFAAALR